MLPWGTIESISRSNNHVYLVGKIAPRQTVRVELASDRDLSGYLRDKRKGYYDPTRYDPDFRIDRVALMLDAMFHDSESRAGHERPLANETLHDLDLTGQLVLPRPMLAARVSRPGSRLILDNAPSPPKVCLPFSSFAASRYSMVPCAFSAGIFAS